MKRKMSLKALIKYAILSRETKPAYHVFFKVSKKIEKLLNKKDVVHTIDVYSIKHIINQHGDRKKENKRGMVPITLDAFDKIPTILKKYDKIDVVVKKGKTRVIYQKKYRNEFYYIEELLKGRKELTCVTMYIKKTSKK